MEPPKVPHNKGGGIIRPLAEPKFSRLLCGVASEMPISAPKPRPTIKARFKTKIAMMRPRILSAATTRVRERHIVRATGFVIALKQARMMPSNYARSCVLEFFGLINPAGIVIPSPKTGKREQVTESRTALEHLISFVRRNHLARTLAWKLEVVKCR